MDQDKKSVSILMSKTFSGTVGPKSVSRMKQRRHSYGFSGVPGVRPIERTSQVGIDFKRPILMYLNTYQLDTHYKFHVPTVTKATEAALDEIFTGHIYNPHESPAVAMRIAGEIMRTVKAMCFNRYRIFTVCTIGQKRAQSYSNAICFLWDHERDNYVDVIREVTTAFVQS